MKNAILPCLLSSDTSRDLQESYVRVEMMNHVICLDRQRFLQIISDKSWDRSSYRNYYDIAAATLLKVDIKSLADDDPKISELNYVKLLRFWGENSKLLVSLLLRNFYIKTHWFPWWLQNVWIKILSIPWWLYFFWIYKDQMTICTQND